MTIFFKQLLLSLTSGVDRLGKTGFFAAFLLLVGISLFLVPLPTWLLDLLLVFNIVVALVLLLRGLFIEDPVQIYAFPTLLLLFTLFRLALNVSSTRLILLGGHESSAAAGSVIQSFGEFVVQGNFGVGAIIFAVIAIVNFVVIAKGSARVAEVSARFTLDALPGKQLAIDSDLRSEAISREEAEIRRDAIRRESQFFGNMDGAMKFVQGDAVAGFVITGINIVGGVGIGVNQGMSFKDAISSFGVLTIGDGLVGIIPSLLISVCAGIIVTHVGGIRKESSGSQVFEQMLADPAALMIAGLVLICLGLIGFPFLPFFLVGFLVFLLGSIIWRRNLISPGGNSAELSGMNLSGPGYGTYLSPQASPFLPEPASNNPVGLIDYFSVRPLVVEVADIDDDKKPQFRDEFYRFFNVQRDKTYRSRGLILPEIELVFSPDLDRDSYVISVREKTIRRGEFYPEYHFTPVSEAYLRTLGYKPESSCKHPLDSRSCCWVDAQQDSTMALEQLGVSVYSAAKFLCLESIGSSFESIDDILGIEEVTKLLDLTSGGDSTLSKAVFEKELINLSEFSNVLRRLVKENVNIRDLRKILESVLEYSSVNAFEKDRQQWLGGLHSYLRTTMARSIIESSLTVAGEFRTFSLSDAVEEEFRSASSVWDSPRSRLPIEPSFETALKGAAERMFAPVFQRGALPIVLICPEDIRVAVQEFFSSSRGRNDSWFRTVAFEELDGRWSPQCVGVLKV